MNAANVAKKLLSASAAGSQTAVNVLTLANYEYTRYTNNEPNELSLVNNIGDNTLTISTVSQLLEKYLVAYEDNNLLNRLALKILYFCGIVYKKMYTEINKNIEIQLLR